VLASEKRKILSLRTCLPTVSLKNCIVQVDNGTSHRECYFVLETHFRFFSFLSNSVSGRQHRFIRLHSNQRWSGITSLLSKTEGKKRTTTIQECLFQKTTTNILTLKSEKALHITYSSYICVLLLMVELSASYLKRVRWPS